jgi:hypothetical protein
MNHVPIARWACVVAGLAMAVALASCGPSLPPLDANNGGTDATSSSDSQMPPGCLTGGNPCNDPAICCSGVCNGPPGPTTQCQ